MSNIKVSYSNLSKGALLIILILISGLGLSLHAQDHTSSAIKLNMFALSEVELLDSPFKKAMELDGKYLLRLEADRLLAPYLEEAGLDPKGESYGGWEAQGEIGEGLDGHSLGHYLSALSMIYASTGKQAFGERLNYVVSELKRAQKANKTGYIGGVPNGEEIINEVRSGDIEAESFALNGSWVPWYNLHKLFAGLRDAHRHAENEQALDILIKLSDWTVEWADDLSEEQFQEMLQTEHGGMKEVMADLYAITGDQRYLELSDRFTHEAIEDPLAENEDQLEGLHANTQIPKIIGAARNYEVSGNEEMRELSTFFWQTVVNGRTYANGGNSDGEHFGPKGGIISEELSRSSSETCNTYNMLKLTRHLSQWEADAAYADYYERALYNHILASQDSQTGMFAYYISMEPGTYKTFSKPFDSFWCCVGSGMENHTKYGRYIYMHGEDELYVNLFIPSELNWQEQGISLRQETAFPESEKSTFTVSTESPHKFVMKVRRPSWAGDGFTIFVNGEKVEVSQQPSNYIAIERTWKDGDKIEVQLPMKTRTEPLSGDDSKIAFMHGPILLAGIVGEEVPIQGQYAGSEQYEYFDLPTVDVPGLEPENDKTESWMKSSQKPLQFELQNVGEASGITLAPFYQVNHEHYTVYWGLNHKNN
ncbi:glycoside hydrolase family 127 protein [Fodinibius sp. Rm-B-1B1-1]|uniref:glycoside hydrolase family 127 protein n=1 Tax=Fodinibius alkaliphilus TaxID=3140241 RepID=UPI00315A771E